LIHPRESQGYEASAAAPLLHANQARRQLLEKRQGATGPAGKDGITQTHTTVLRTKKWEIDVEQSLAREILSDGSRMPALNLRPMFESLAHALRVQSLVEESDAQAMRTAMSGRSISGRSSWSS
jgi:hypothetical protein